MCTSAHTGPACVCGRWKLWPAIAQALADERERARAPFLALASEWEDATREWYYANRHTHPNGIGWVGGYEEGWDHAAELVRRAAEETGQ